MFRIYLIAIIAMLTIASSNGFSKDDTSSVKTSYKKNIISYDYLSPLFSKATLSYERILAKGKLGIRAISSYGFKERNGPVPLVWSSGLEIKLYPNGQKRFMYYFGFQGNIGYVNSRYYSYGYPNYYEYKDQFYYSLYAMNGVFYNPFSNLGVNLAIGIGLYEYEDVQNFNKHAIIEMGINYRF